MWKDTFGASKIDLKTMAKKKKRKRFSLINEKHLNNIRSMVLHFLGTTIPPCLFLLFFLNSRFLLNSYHIHESITRLSLSCLHFPSKYFFFQCSLLLLNSSTWDTPFSSSLIVQGPMPLEHEVLSEYRANRCWEKGINLGWIK